MALRDVRIERGITQVACARKIGINRTTYAKYEKEPWRFTLQQAYILKNALNCSYEDIYLPTDV